MLVCFTLQLRLSDEADIIILNQVKSKETYFWKEHELDNDIFNVIA